MSHVLGYLTIKYFARGTNSSFPYPPSTLEPSRASKYKTYPIDRSENTYGWVSTTHLRVQIVIDPFRIDLCSHIVIMITREWASDIVLIVGASCDGLLAFGP